MSSQSKIQKARGPKSNAGAKLKRDKARNALRDSQIGLEIVVLQIGKFLDEYAMVKSDKERAEILNRCIHYLSHHCMSGTNLSQLANCQSELLLLDAQLAISGS